MNELEPWKDEPDFKLFIDNASGLKCAVLRHPHTGHLCGYVRVPRGKLYDKIVRRGKQPGWEWAGKLRRAPAYTWVERRVTVHGGLTWAGKFRGRYQLERGLWVGFDCAHAGDLMPKLQFKNVQQNIYRDMQYVTNECQILATQIKTVMEKLK